MRYSANIKIVNVYKTKDYDVYIGRPKAGQPDNIWKNPYPIDSKNPRDVVIARHMDYLIDKLFASEITVEQILSLQGKTLGCFCENKPCHGHNYVKIIEQLLEDGISTQAQFLAKYSAT
jgi:hypothetical protein